MFYPIKGGSKIVVGEGFQCHLPPIPSDKSQIINYGLPIEEQYWKREPIPKWYLERSLEEEYKQRQEMELVLKGKKKTLYVDPMCERFRRMVWHRRIYGLWFMNEGDPTYITGHHYFYLQWSKFDHKINDGYPLYYEFSRDNFYIRNWCEQNPFSLGYLMIAARGTGKSNEEIATIMNRATYFHKHRVGMQGKHHDDTKAFIESKFVPLFNELPNFLKPAYSHGTLAKNELDFTRPSTKGKSVGSILFGQDIELGSKIFAAQPGERVLDRETLGDCYATEVGKTSPNVADVYQRHLVNIKTVYRNHRKVGLIREESTVEEMNEGGAECEKIWKGSDPNKLDGSGWTKTKTHRHFISALDTDTSLDPFMSNGKMYPAPCTKYGKVDRTLANIKIQNDLDFVKHDLKEVSSRMRKSPRNITEAFIKDQSKSVFNIMILSDRLEHIRNRMSKKPYVRGNLYWLKEPFGPVGWKHDDHAGRFNWAWFPDEYTGIKDPDQWKILNNFGSEWGYDKRGYARKMLFPKNDHLFRIGGDPIKFKKTKDPRASKAAIHGFRMFDPLADYGKPKHQWESKNFIFEYINRPDDPKMASEDAAMACIFLGCKILPENNIQSFNDYFESNGLEKFLGYPKDFIYSDDGPKKKDDDNGPKDEDAPRFQTNSEDAGYSSTPDVIDYYTKRLITFINEHGHRMPFDNTIESWMEFDPNEPTKYDATVSSGFTLIHAEKRVEAPDHKPQQTISEWFETYHNDGVVGQFATVEEDN